MLPLLPGPPFRDRLTAVRVRHAADVEAGAGWVALPDALGTHLLEAGYNIRAIQELLSRPRL
ncbi:hypothetical protein WMF26_31090 [Sorangium sp. So ce185]|uniref:hypothetical protein n=1 Tax=Sorangium sp. So ce185 TaxID=3133287 RepID=UPI003F61706E